MYLPRMMRAASMLKLQKRIQLSRSDERLEIVTHGFNEQIARWIQKPSCSEPRGGFYPKRSWVLGHSYARETSSLRGGYCQVAELNAHQWVEAQCVEATMLCAIVSA